jgi:inosine-uridine nucleoside N-ribohydrolase
MPAYLFEVPEKKKCRVIIDSDTACEADDPFAIAYALLSPKLIVRGIVAEHFAQPGSMEKSRAAARKLVSAMGLDMPVYAGQDGPDDPSVSEGVSLIIREALNDDPHPLYVLCMGALTNMARAIREQPEITSRLTVVTIGGHPYEEEEIPWKEFNFGNDPAAANFVLQSDAPVWQIPSNVYGSIRVGIAELQERVRPCGLGGRYLFDQLAEYNASPAADWNMGESWSLGDSPSVAAVLNPRCGRTSFQRVREVREDTSYGIEIPGVREILVYRDMDSRYLLEDFFAKLALNYLD